MLIQKVKCPYGCENSMMMESLKTVSTSNPNVLLDSKQAFGQSVQSVKVYTCQCCTKSFETPVVNENFEGGRMVL